MLRNWMSLSLGLTLLSTALLVASPGRAIMIRHDVNDGEYVVSDADFPSLVVLFPPDDCAATLVHPSLLLTVAHCAVDLVPGDFLFVDGSAEEVSEVLLHPEWRDSRDEYDIALVRLLNAISTVEPLPVYRGTNELGRLVTIVGPGLSGTGLDGERNATSDGQLRRATNVVTAVDEHWIQMVFDEDEQQGGSALEGIGASGDSGGPVLLDVNGTLAVAGLNSFGEGCDGARLGGYESFDYQTRVSQYAAWLESVDSFTFVGSDDVGDPSASPDIDFCFGCVSGPHQTGPAIAGILALVVRRRRRTTRECRKGA